MRIIRFLSRLIPPQLKQFDRWLLLNRPHLWETQVHVAVFGISLLALLAFAVQQLTPFSIQNLPDPTNHFIGGTILTGVLLLFYAVWLLRFQAHKQFGNVNPWQNIRNSLLYAWVIAMSVSVPFWHAGQVQDQIAATIYDRGEIAADLNQLHQGEIYIRSFKEAIFYSEQLPYLWHPWTHPSLRDRDELIAAIQEVSPREGEVILQEYAQIIRKYSQAPFEFRVQEVFTELNQDYDLYTPPLTFIVAQTEAKANLERLQKAQLPRKYWGEEGVLLLLAGIAYLFWLSLMSIRTIGWRRSLLAFLGGIPFSVAILLLVSLTGYASSLSANGVSLVVYLILWISIFLLGAMREGHPGTIRISIITGALISPAFPSLLFFLLYELFHESLPETLVGPLIGSLAGILFSIILWILIFQPRLQRLQAQPGEG